MDSNYRLGLYEKAMPNFLSIAEKLTYAKKFGFDYLELSIDESDEKLKRLDMPWIERKKIIDAMHENGISIDSICLSGHRKYPMGSLQESVVKRSMEIMEKAILLAKDLGIRMIQLAGYDVYYEQGNDRTKQFFQQNLKKAVSMASRYGLLLGFETMETPFMDTVEKAMTYVTQVDSSYLHVYPDIGNLTNAAKLYGHDVNEDIRKGKGHIIAAHLKETLSGKYREIPYGTGHTQFVSNIRQLAELGVFMFVGEFWYVGQEDWQEDIRKANVFLRNHLDRVFV